MSKLLLSSFQSVAVQTSLVQTADESTFQSVREQASLKQTGDESTFQSVTTQTSLVLRQNIQSEEQRTVEATKERQRMLLQLIEERNKLNAYVELTERKENLNALEEHPGPPLESNSYDAAEHTIDTHDADVHDTQSHQWSQTKPIPKAMGNCQTVIAGDSILKSLSPRRLSESEGHSCCVDSVRGASIATIAERIPAVLETAEAVERVVISVGGNDLGKKSLSECMQDFDDLLRPFERHPNVQLSICSILPRKQPAPLNHSHVSLNKSLWQLCRQRNVHLFDCSSSFPLSNCTELLDNDGVHLSQQGVRRLASCMIVHLGGRKVHRTGPYNRPKLPSVPRHAVSTSTRHLPNRPQSSRCGRRVPLILQDILSVQPCGQL